VIPTSSYSVPRVGDLVELERPDPRLGWRTAHERRYGGCHAMVLFSREMFVDVLIHGGPLAGELTSWPTVESRIIG
jgi:hypothetical protein